jgi:histone H3/H4
MQNTHLVVRTQIKELAGTLSVSKDFSDELDKKVHEIIHKAIERAKANGRTTIMPRDI